MKLLDLKKIIPVPPKFYEVDFNGLNNDSKKIQPGELFIAVRGYKTDGYIYLDEAIRRGASAAIVEADQTGPAGLPVLPVAYTRRVQGRVAAQFYGEPSRRMRLIGVTGTNGKTTVTHLIEHLLNSSYIPTGLIGTVWINNGRERQYSTRTTPDSIELQRLFAGMMANGIETVVMEVSSHALALERTAGSEYDVAVLTNITHDHFDFHRNYQQYMEAKLQLFRNLDPAGKPGKYAVLNRDDPSSEQIASECRVPVIFYGEGDGSFSRLEAVERTGLESLIRIRLGDEECRVRTRLPGEFNIYNILAAVTVAYREGLSVEDIEAALPDFPGVPGRYQEINCGQPFRVMVDFAHNPAALENILKMAGEYTRGRRILVFGCEGEKDRVKRPLMGAIAAYHAEVPILTSDNVYHEDILQIFTDVLQSLSPGEQGRFIIEPDRRKAIKTAVSMANPGDFLIVAGKGHEQYLVQGNQKLHFDDAEELRRLLQRTE